MTVARLAARLGIADRFRDLTGTDRDTLPETRAALLRAMSVDSERAGEVLAELEAGDASRILPLWRVVTAGVPVASGVQGAWAVELEDGRTFEGRGGLGVLPLGIHRLQSGGQVCWLLSAPARLPVPVRSWGVTLPLYGLRTKEQGGIGSYADLGRAVSAMRGSGASFVGINPVHAGFPTDPEEYSPYSPSSRRRLNVLHVEVGAPGTPGKLIDYRADVPARMAALRRAYGEASQDDAFLAWRAGEGPALQRFAVHQALSDRFGPFWTDWPAACRDPAAPEVAAFAAEAEDDVRFHAWAQWMASTQLEAAGHAAEGMAFGLYLDLAVGTHPAGAETWAEPGLYGRGVSLGAPPDTFAPHGQNWTLAPLDPRALVSAGFRPLAETLRAQFRYARLLRIDHILGFERAYWVPEDGSPGAYVTMPREAMLAVARIEAARVGATVIGEDLGNLPAGLREALAASGILGCRVAMFEGTRRASDYDAAALTSFATHDLPPLRAWQEARDIDWHARLGHIPAAAAADARKARARDVAAFTTLIGGNDADALTAFLAETPSQLVALQIEDLVGADEQANLPGTVYDHPNWRRRLPCKAEDLGRIAALEAARPLMKTAGREPEA